MPNRPAAPPAAACRSFTDLPLCFLSLQDGISDAQCIEAAKPLQRSLLGVNYALRQYVRTAGSDDAEALRALRDLDFVLSDSSGPAICAWASVFDILVFHGVLESADMVIKCFAKPTKAARAVRHMAARCAALKQTLLAMPIQARAGGGGQGPWASLPCICPMPPAHRSEPALHPLPAGAVV